MRPTDLPKYLERVIEKLHAVGVPATISPDQIPVPGAWVMVSNIEGRFLGGEIADGEYEVTLVARDTGTVSALAQLCEMMELVGQALPVAADCEITTLRLPGQGGVLPAITLTYEL